MGFNPNQVWTFNRNLIDVPTSYNYRQGPLLGVLASSLYFRSDNINQNLTRSLGPLTGWAMSEANSSSSRDHTLEPMTQYNWDRWADQGLHQDHSWYLTTNRDVTELNDWGYVGSFYGSWTDARNGLSHPNFLNQGNTTSDVIDVYGHGASTGDLPADNSTQFRNSAALPVDGSCVITTTGSTFNRGWDLFPAFYGIWIVQGGTAGSNTVQFIVEKRPPVNDLASGQGTAKILLSADYQWSSAWWNSQLTLAQMEYLGYLLHAQTSGTQFYYQNGWDDARYMTRAQAPVDKLIGKLELDPRSKNRATFLIDSEYIGMVMSTFVMIYSSKSNLNIPLCYFDMAPLFAGSHKRIAGVAVRNNQQIYVLSESGDLVLIDFTTVKGGAVTVLASAPALAATGHRYSGLELDAPNSTLWALSGLYSIHPWEITDGTAGLGLTRYDIGATTWDTCKVSSVPGRVGPRDLNNLVISGTKAVFLSDSISAAQRTDIPVFAKAADRATGQYAFWGTANNVFAWPLSSRRLAYEGTLDTRFRFAWTTPPGGNVNVTGAKLVWVPKGSPAGTTITGSLPITFNTGAAGFAWTGTNATKESDTISVTFSRDYDYYLWVQVPGNFGSINTSGRPGFGMSHYDNTIVGLGNTIPDTCNNLTGSLLFDDVVFNSPVDVFQQNTIADGPSWKYSAIVYDITGDTWTAITSATFGLRPAYWNFHCGDIWMPEDNTTRWENRLSYMPTSTLAVDNATGDVLFQLSPSFESIWHFRPGTEVLTKVTTWADETANWGGNNYGSRAVSMLRNTQEASVLISRSDWVDGGTQYSGTVGTCLVYDTDYDWTTPVAPYSLTWNTTPAFQHGKGAKRIVYLALGPSGGQSYPLVWADHAIVNWMVSAESYQTRINVRNANTACQWTPRYYYWSGAAWEVTCDHAKAVASPRTVLDQNTQYPIQDGLVLKFGPDAGSTFSTDEFHTLNATWGKVKYTRKARYTAAAFAGRTFSNTETKNMSAMLAMSYKSFNATSYAIETSAGGPITGSTGTNVFSWPKRTGANWTIDINAGVWPRVIATFAALADFSDIALATSLARGIIWEVSTDGTTFTPITPLWRSHNGTYWTFPRQTGISKVRATFRQPQNASAANFTVGGLTFVDYGTQTQIDAARLGLTGAPAGTAAKGSWENGCLGIAGNVVVAIDGQTVYMNNPLHNDAIATWYNNTPVPAGFYKVHPFYGFILFEGAGTAGTLSTKPGAQAVVSYFWGKRV
jgi:hypothetical protein